MSCCPLVRFIWLNLLFLFLSMKSYQQRITDYFWERQTSKLTRDTRAFHLHHGQRDLPAKYVADESNLCVLRVLNKTDTGYLIHSSHVGKLQPAHKVKSEISVTVWTASRYVLGP